MEMQVQSALNFSGTVSDAGWKGNLDLETCKEEDIMLRMDKQPASQESQVENIGHTRRSR